MSGVRQISKAVTLKSVWHFWRWDHDKRRVFIGEVGEFWRDWLTIVWAKSSLAKLRKKNKQPLVARSVAWRPQ